MEVTEGAKPRFRLDVVSGDTGRIKFAELLNRAFAVPAGQEFFDDFPVWDERVLPQGETLIRLGAFTADGRLAACAGVRLATLSAPHAAPWVALIGAVATDPDFRGHGLASGVVNFACEWAQARGASAIFLWGSEHSLYQRLGFELCGAQTLIPLKSIAFRSAGSAVAKLRHAEGWNSGILELMMRRKGGLRLHRGDEAWLAAHRNVQWHWLGEGEKPFCYAAVGRGIDLGGIVHEWGGDSNALHRLLSELKVRNPGLAILGPPQGLADVGIPTVDAPQEYLCLARVLDATALGRAFGSKVPSLGLDPHGVAQAVFGVPGGVSKETDRRGGFPLPLWIWGLDAV